MESELIERSEALASLQDAFQQASSGEGRCVFVSGEAGIGKTTLLKAFIRAVKNTCTYYEGTCDALFTPRPLAPLYDILLQMKEALPEIREDNTGRIDLFMHVFQRITQHHKTVLIVFEDIHWADEATLDFIKFLSRRITRLRCLFMLTYRDNEIHNSHPLRQLLGQLPAGSFTRLQLRPLSRTAVEQLATIKGYNGNEVYSISGGNPFYVQEILANYSPGIPDNIRDSILSVYNRQNATTKQVWELLSALPAGISLTALSNLEKGFTAAIGQCLESGILLLREGQLTFKHELYRITIEGALSPLEKIGLNKKILTLFREIFEREQAIEKIIHHAKHAHETALVAFYAPIAAQQATQVGAHIEAAKLYITAIEYYQGEENDTLYRLYESYAYQCYLINHIREAISYTEKALAGWRATKNQELIGNSLRFLSRLSWFVCQRTQAESYGLQAVEVLAQQPPSRAKAMAYSNMAQLTMLSDHHDECLAWGEKAIAIAEELGDQEILSHALNNVGSVQMRINADITRGKTLLEQSLDIALKNDFQEHVARAYTNLGSKTVSLKAYDLARNYLNEGIHYCEERDLDSWTSYMLSQKARLLLETGEWTAASEAAERLLNNNQTPVNRIGALVVAGSLQLRCSTPAIALQLLTEAKDLAFEALELQRVLPVLTALLEYEWLTREPCIEMAALQQTIDMMQASANISGYNEFAFWLQKAGRPALPSSDIAPMRAVSLWEKANCPYEQALVLFEGTEADKKLALVKIQELGAHTVAEKLKNEMRLQGIKSIPRGTRKSTLSNPSQLTLRELDVLQLLQEGMPNKAIAARLYISAKTVDHHISSILFKLDAPSRMKAVQAAIRQGIIKA
jgi:DNA-binding CsgD family transcriptional regulator